MRTQKIFELHEPWEDDAPDLHADVEAILTKIRGRMNNLSPDEEITFSISVMETTDE